MGWGGGEYGLVGSFDSFIMTSASTNLVWGFLYCSAQLKEQQKGHRNKSFYMPSGFKNWVMRKQYHIFKEPQAIQFA